MYIQEAWNRAYYRDIISSGPFRLVKTSGKIGDAMAETTKRPSSWDALLSDNWKVEHTGTNSKREVLTLLKQVMELLEKELRDES